MSNTFTSSDITGFFLSDATEHLQAINDDLLELEQNQDELTVVDKIFRAVHAIKGSAGMAGFFVVSQLAHKVEDVLGKLREQELVVSSDIVDLLFQGVDTLSHQVDNIANGQPEEESALKMVVELYAEILGTSEMPPPKTLPPKAKASSASPAPNGPPLGAPKTAKPNTPATAPKAPPKKPAPATTPSAKPVAPATVSPKSKTVVPPPSKPTPQSKPAAVPAQVPPPAAPAKPAVVTTEQAEQHIRENQVDQAVVIYRKLLSREMGNKQLRQRLEEAIALQAYLKENPA
jgi:two-component system, chemotaxis family, sensor kinase CheA